MEIPPIQVEQLVEIACGVAQGFYRISLREKTVLPLNHEALGGPGIFANGDLMTKGRRKRQKTYEDPSRRAICRVLNSMIDRANYALD